MAIQSDLRDHQEPASALKTSSSGRSRPSSPEGASALTLPAASSLLPRHGPQRRPEITLSDQPAELTRVGPKRRRALHDVDGPHTGSLSCKKRRLRRHLITSRLSRPYSSPATHILNREAAAGAKRFLKMAAAASARKLTTVVVPTPPTADWGSGRAVAAAQVATVVPANSIHHLAPAEMVRRAAIMNSFRIRVCDEARQRGERTDLQLAASAALLRAGPGQQGVGFVTTPKTAGAHTSLSSSPTQDATRDPGLGPYRSTMAFSPTKATQPSLTANTTRMSPPVQHAGGTASYSPPNSPNKHPRPRGAGRTSPGTKPLRSPELLAQGSHAECGGLDDDELSFPATDYSDDFLENESDEVYTDFGAIFGGCGEDGDEARDSGEALRPAGEGSGEHGVEHFEDYMDDLDGIPWGAR
ncbi:hypothetical protein KVR01_013745 [Diaporthe batatas]|uniref:uncharacterized protein n=1 Tax=Diaporthe batatas TaxID=748121 RepID=UPI001D052ADA|nr:uncharacterized protein KVR01_013745 [Diaporthe batatas]KAG8156404.1 hypothetical protein KVR01_013745 [Diaporthe batatas]